MSRRMAAIRSSVLGPADKAPMRLAGRPSSQRSNDAAKVGRSAWSAGAGRAKEDIDINIEIVPRFRKVEEPTEVTPDGQMTGLDWAPVQPPPASGPSRNTADRSLLYVAQGYWNDRALSDGLEAAASLRPDAVGLIDNQRSLTWAELGRLVARAVSTLTELGVSPGDPVLLIAENSSAGVIAYHGLLRIGVRAVLLDRRCGMADVRAALDAILPKLVIIPAGERDRLGAELADCHLITLEHFVAADPVSVEGRDWPEPNRDEVAVILFTSGTTSRPKGVTHSLNTLTCGARNMALITEAGPDTVIFLVSPLTSITGVMQMHLAADQHATLVLEDHFDAETSLDRINEHEASLLGGAPVIVERLIKAADRRPGRRCALRTLALGGTMLPRPLLQHVMDDYGVKVARVYGSSEAPNASGSMPDDVRELRLTDDGALMPGTEIRVGSQEHPQEGLVRGPGVFLGYLNEADNGLAFEGDWYRTGDLVEVSEGRLTVVGRLKEVVNRNGFKISLAEIDAAMFGMTGLEEAASFALPDAATGERLALAIVPSEGAVLGLEDVAAHLRSTGVATRRLPEELVIWDEPLPRTASGKIVRSRLVMDAPSKSSIVAPRLRPEAPPNTSVASSRK
jgi:acyl-CoA synthetase (AMP-forming)/AMP-acid ligase II